MDNIFECPVKEKQAEFDDKLFQALAARKSKEK
jgi:uncharacterized protein (UPF0305 family)